MLWARARGCGLNPGWRRPGSGAPAMNPEPHFAPFCANIIGLGQDFETLFGPIEKMLRGEITGERAPMGPGHDI